VFQGIDRDACKEEFPPHGQKRPWRRTIIGAVFSSRMRHEFHAFAIGTTTKRAKALG